MALYRCMHCHFVAEEGLTPAGQQVACSKCGKPATVYPTVFYVEKLLERYAAVSRELETLKARQAEATRPAATPAPGAQAGPLQHAPLEVWLRQRQIAAEFDAGKVNTTGYFDEAAQQFGTQYELFGDLLRRVQWSYKKSHTGLNIELAPLDQKAGQALQRLCRDLYSHTLFSRYHYQKPEKVIRLSLQPATAVRQFFDGEWLEWFALGEVLQLGQQAGAQPISVARGVKLTFPNEDLHEIDVMGMTLGQQPFCIECKSGEFRRDIDKLLRVRRKLGLPRERFIVCATDLDSDQASSLSAMYELSFVHLQGLQAHLASLR
ncbi:MAG: hypothetical protein ACN6O3_12065 [Comamonas sp.]